MAIIKNKDIYDSSKSELPKLIELLDKVIKKEEEWTKANNDLSDSLQKVKKTNDGTEAKKLVEGTDKLTKSTLELKDAKVLTAEVNKQVVKAQEAVIKADSAEAIELEKLKLQKKDQVKLNKEVAEELRKIEKGYQKEIKSINSLRESNKKLNKERNNLNLETEDGIKRLKEINDQLDENNEIIKENSDSYAKQKINIGNYGSALNDIAPGMVGAAQGFKQMTIQALKFIATPIGAVMAIIVIAFKSLQAAFNRNLGAQEKLNQITGKLSAAFGFLLDILQPVVNFIVDSVLKAFDDMGKAVVFVIEKLEKWGIIAEGTAEKLDKTSQAAERLATAERRLIESNIALEKLQLRFQTLAEAQRQIRDDEALSIDERIAANVELGKILTAQAQAEIKQANNILQIARDRAIVDGNQLHNIEEIGQAEIKLLEITERVEAQRSEQLVNTNSLLREQAKIELDAFNAKLERFEKEQEIFDKEQEDQETEEEAVLRQMEIDDEQTENFNINQRLKQNEVSKTNDEFTKLATDIALISVKTGEELGNLMAQGLLTFKEFGKILLKTTLDIVQRQVNIYLAGILAREFFTKGLAGIISAGVLTGLVNAAFRVAKAGISNFNDGTEYVPGEGNQDTVPAMLTPGERVVPAEINQMLGGIPNSDLPKLLNKQDNNMLVASLLMSGNGHAKDLVTLMGNMCWTYDRNGERVINKADGSLIEKFNV